MNTGVLYRVAIVLCLLFGVGLRFIGLTRGASDFAPHTGTEYYHFHPDEGTLVRTASVVVDPFDPPFTAYGLLPVYVLRGALWVQGLEAPDLGRVEERQRVFVTARFLSALLSSLVLVATCLLGARSALALGRGPTLLGLAFISFAPGAIQQGHFFIVDGVFTTLSLGILLLIAQVVRTGALRWYLLAGLLIGLLGAVRYNGLALGLVLAVGHFIRSGEGFYERLRRPGLWLAGGLALVTVVALQPYLLVHPAILTRAETNADFALSLSFARLEILQHWSLVDFQAVRYWDHWFGLWPWICGWPLTLAMIAGAGYMVWFGTGLQRLVLLWCGLYFLIVGAVPVKAVRYMVPILPVLGLYTGVFCTALWRRWRLVGVSTAVGLVVYGAVYGLAFARVYIDEDSRIQAGRWIAAQVPAGRRVGLEAGAFSLRDLVDSQVHPHSFLNISGLFYGSNYMLCGQQVDYIGDRLEEMDWLALVEENRAVQFRSVPELFPVVEDFYARLLAGNLGFEPVQRFAVEVEVGGFRFPGRLAEPSFLAYDHPSVRIFKRREEVVLQEALAAWRSEIAGVKACPDRLLKQMAQVLESGAPSEALGIAEQIQTRYPRSALVHLLAAEAHRHLGYEIGAKAAYGRYLPEASEGHVQYSPFAHYVPGDAALACAELGLESLALSVLRRGVEEISPRGVNGPQEVAESYLKVGRWLVEHGHLGLMEEACELSLNIHPHKAAYNVLAELAYERGEYERAIARLKRSLTLDEAQGYAHATLGKALLDHRADPEIALGHLARAVELDPAQRVEFERWIAMARARLSTER